MYYFCSYLGLLGPSRVTSPPSDIFFPSVALLSLEAGGSSSPKAGSIRFPTTVMLPPNPLRPPAAPSTLTSAEQENLFSQELALKYVKVCLTWPIANVMLYYCFMLHENPCISMQSHIIPSKSTQILENSCKVSAFTHFTDTFTDHGQSFMIL